MSRHEELITLLREKIKDAGQEADVLLTDETPVISSGLISSLHLLELATWIEEQIEGEIDLMGIDPLEVWDTPNAIIQFIDAHQPHAQGSPQSS